jgi:phosphoglycerate kinase
MKTLSDFNFKDKVVLLRSDLNSDVVNGKVLMSERIKESAKTIIELKNKKAKVVILAHQGNPGKKDFISLKQHAKFLNKFVKVKFVEDILGEKAISAIKKLKSGDAILLENIRFENDEFNETENNKFSALSALADFYVNDAFSVCHRKHASIIFFPKKLKSCAGRLLEKEVNALEKLKIENSLYILGGSKPEDNLKLFKKGNHIIVGGIFGQLCLIASGKNLGENNEIENKTIVKDYDKIITKIKSRIKSVNPIMPVDYAVEINNKRKEFSINEFPTEHIIYDLGKMSQQIFINEIKKAKAIYMKGPVGFTSKKQFSFGTTKILKAISNSESFSIIGGGHLSDAIKNSKIPKKKFNHISLSGGALLNYVAGEKLVGLKMLK